MNSSTRIQIDTLLHCRWIVPIVPAAVVLDQHSIAIHEGRICAILPTTAAHDTYQASREFTLDRHAVMPGLINTHGHAAMSLLRGIADDQPLHDWLQDTIWPLESRWVSEDFVYHGTQLAIAEMLRGGTTCFADMYFFPDACARAAMDAHIRVQLAAPVFDFPSAWGNDAEDYIHKATLLHDQFRHSDLVSTAFGPHAPYTVADAPLRKIVMLAEELDMPIHMHVHETAQEVSDALSSSGKRPLQRLTELGLLSPRLLCVHATQLLAEEIADLAEAGVSVVHCPESNMKLASGSCPVDQLLKASVNVALGTDGAASNNDLDMFSELRTAALLAKLVASDASALPAFKALEMATLAGAKALGLAADIGSLEAGKAADIIAVDLSALNCLPVYHPIPQLVYSTQASQVSHVWVAGKLRLQDGQLQGMAVQALREQILHWQEKLNPAT